MLNIKTYMKIRKQEEIEAISDLLKLLGNNEKHTETARTFVLQQEHLCSTFPDRIWASITKDPEGSYILEIKFNNR